MVCSEGGERLLLSTFFFLVLKERSWRRGCRVKSWGCRWLEGHVVFTERVVLPNDVPVSVECMWMDCVWTRCSEPWWRSYVEQ